MLFQFLCVNFSFHVWHWNWKHLFLECLRIKTLIFPAFPSLQNVNSVEYRISMNQSIYTFVFNTTLTEIIQTSKIYISKQLLFLHEKLRSCISILIKQQQKPAFIDPMPCTLNDFNDCTRHFQYIYKSGWAYAHHIFNI